MGINSVELDMHREVDWIAPADDYILDFLEACRCANDDPAKQTPKTIGLNTPYSRKHAGTRCRVLAEHGLLERHERGVYSITELGEQYVAGDVDASELERCGEDAE